jgi:TonB family protein
MYRTRILTGLLAASILCAYSQEPVTISDSSKAIAAVAVDQATGADTTHPPADFVDVDKEPVVITKKEPVYPALALKAGMEGRVWVKIWVDKSGLPHQAIILKSDQEIFNAPALDAAMQFRFTPASLKGNPVDVWVSVPFRFKLAEKKEPQKAPPDTVYGKVPRPIIDFLRQVLEGSAPDTARVSALLTAKAEAIAGGYLKPLRQAIEEQRQGKESIEQRGEGWSSSRTGWQTTDGAAILLPVPRKQAKINLRITTRSLFSRPHRGSGRLPTGTRGGGVGSTPCTVQLYFAP